QSVRDKLLAKYSSFPALSVERLEHMIPNNVDNVRPVLEIDRVASKYGMSIKNIQLQTNDLGSVPKGAIIGGNDKLYGTVSLGFSADGPYKNFVQFLGDLEKSLRIVDIVNVAFTSEEKSVNQYNVKIKTYWLK
ncbi:hypothetical protein KW797_02420, partial [Candidatus Parcubacteria bacterium]|nr:hypothetical protein [Candidatus Parcubacteria bacterium]